MLGAICWKNMTAEYRIWQGMKQRCHNPKAVNYRAYGGRGVVVCDLWRNDFVAFISEIGPRPSKAHSVDRYPNPAGNYEPGNVRWATPKEQGANRRESRLKCGATSEQIFALRREGLMFKDITAKLGVCEGTAFLRCKRAGIRAPKMPRPPRRHLKMAKIVSASAAGLPITEIGAFIGIPQDRIAHILTI